MPKKPNPVESARVFIRPSKEVAAYLDELALLGIHGKTRSEVATALVGRGIERLIREGFLKLRRQE